MSTKKVDRIGETALASNGQRMTIIRYDSCKHIDVEFEDRTIVEDKAYSDFLKGKIENPNKPNRKKSVKYIGLKNMNTQGFTMTIIKYRGANDIDVQFDDKKKTVVSHVRVDHFKEGAIYNPNYRIGIKSKNTLGDIIEIVDWRNDKSIDVLINGTKTVTTTYERFKCGYVYLTAVDVKSERKRREVEGTEFITNDGRRGTITRYHDARNVDIVLDDGNQLTNIQMDRVTRGSLFVFNNHIGEKNIARNGMAMEIIGIHRLPVTKTRKKAKNVFDIRFEDGYIAEKKQYHQFLSGSINNPNKTSRRGESFNEFTLAKIMKPYGFKKVCKRTMPEIEGLELDLYNGDFHGKKVAIEYDGFPSLNGKDGHSVQNDNRKNVLCKSADIDIIRIRTDAVDYLNDNISVNIGIGHITKPFSDELKKGINLLIRYLNTVYGSAINEISYFPEKEILEEYKQRFYSEHIGETRINNYGERMVITEFVSWRDCSVEFEDGRLLEHVRYESFKKGALKHPDLKHKNLKIFKMSAKYVGKTFIDKKGRKLKIIDYLSYNNISAQLEDGSTIIVSSKSLIAEA